jgi:hypothetical protein
MVGRRVEVNWNEGGGTSLGIFIASGKVFESNTLPTYSILLESRVFGDVPLCHLGCASIVFDENSFYLDCIGTVLYIRANLADKTCTSSQTRKFLSLHLSLHLSPFTCHLLNVQFATSQTSNLCTAVIVGNATENNTVNSNSRNTAALQPNVFVTGIRTSVTGHNVERSEVPTRSPQDTIALQPNVFVTGIRRLLAITSNDLTSSQCQSEKCSRNSTT